MSKYIEIFKWIESNGIACARNLKRQDIDKNKIYYNYEYADSTYYASRFLNCKRCVEISFYKGKFYLHENYDVHNSSEFCCMEISLETNKIAYTNAKLIDTLSFTDLTDLFNKLKIIINDTKSDAEDEDN